MRPIRSSFVVVALVALVLAACASAEPDPELEAEVTSLGDSPVSGLGDAAIAWTGSEYVVVGGVGGSEKFGADGEPETADDGPLGGDVALAYAYDPAADSWRTLPPPPLAPRSRALAVWTGEHVLVWGGAPDRNGVGGLLDGALYDPNADTWRPIAAAPAGMDRSFAQAVVVDDRVVIGGGSTPKDDRSGELLVFDPSTDVWTTIPGGGRVHHLLTTDDGAVAVLSASDGEPRQGYRVRVLTLDGQQLGPDVVIDEPSEGEEFPQTAGLAAAGDRLWLLVQPANGGTRVYDLTDDDPLSVVARHTESLVAAGDVWGLGIEFPTVTVDGVAVSSRAGFTQPLSGLRLADGTAVGVEGDESTAARDCVNSGAWATDGVGGLLLVGGECDPALVTVSPLGDAVS